MVGPSPSSPASSGVLDPFRGNSFHELDEILEHKEADILEV